METLKVNSKLKFDQFVPPIILKGIDRFLLNKKTQWEYVPNGWSSNYAQSKSWNDPSIAETQKKRWPDFKRSLEGTGRLTSSHTYLPPNLTKHDLVAHNISMCYGYVLVLAAREKSEINILDWGGGVGHYFLISKALLPDVKINYVVHDKPLLCKYGRELLPEVDFYEDPQDVFKRQYDLVFASNSLQYSQDWKEIMPKLAAVARNYFYVTQLQVILNRKSFVVLQRAYQSRVFGYNAEWLGWVLNYLEFVQSVEKTGMKLLREFLIGPGPTVRNAPEQNELLGFLFIS